MKKFAKIRLMIAMVAVLFAVTVCFCACAPRNDVDTQKQEYTITLKLNAEQVWETVTAKAGSAVEYTRPDPVRPNTEFDGWSLTPNGEVVALPTVMPEGNVTYYAVFSRYYNITLDAGLGTYDGESRIRAKVGQNLYGAVKDITPKAPGVSEFDGWYYGNTKLDAESTEVMPANGVTLEARYTVDYSISAFKETGYATAEFEAALDDDGKPVVINGRGFIGNSPLGSVYPVYSGYELTGTETFVLSEMGGNDFEARYTLRGYSLVFNSNVPESDLTVNGSMGVETWGYGEEHELPDCGFSITGYRFSYWSATPDGAQRLSGTHSIAGNETLYAIWTKGYADIGGKSSDYIFIDLDENGNTVAYLRRYYSEEKKGEYDAAAKSFTFKNSDGKVIARGRIDESSHTFLYFDTVAYSYRKYGFIEDEDGLTGTVYGNITLTLSDDGTAIYNDGSVDINGTYAFVAAERSMKFTAASGNKEFFFRIETFRDGNGVQTDVFEIRSESEIGEWQRMKSNGDTDEYFTLELNGYGEAVMSAVSVTAEDPVVTSGLYRFTSSSTAEKPEIVALFVTGGGTTQLRFTLVDNSDNAESDAKYTEFYKEWEFGTTVYAKPANGESVDTENADRFVLDGYGIYADSAAFTIGGNTTTGKYTVDLDARTLRFGDTEYFLDIVTEGEGESAVTRYVYEPKQNKPELEGFYAISGLEERFRPGLAYYFRFFNDGVARLYLLMPQSDMTFGNVYLDAVPAVVGTYEPTSVSGEYVFKAEITPEQIYIVATYYASIFRQALDISNFGDFKFMFTGRNDDGFQAGEVTAIGDGYKGYSLMYGNTAYVTDGYGNAVATNEATGATVTRKYTVNESLGMPSVLLQWTEREQNDAGEMIDVEKSQMYTLIDGAFRAYITEYGKYNTQYASSVPDTTFRLVIYADDYAVLAYDNYSSRTQVMYSYGKVTWTDESKRFGKFGELGSVNGSAAILVSRYGNFMFGLKTVTVTQNDKETQVDRMFVYDADPAEITDGKFTVNGENGATLVFDITNATAEYSAPDADAEGGAVKFSGEFKYADDIATILDTTEIDGQSYVVQRTFKLVRTDDGKITSFKSVGTEAGTWQNAVDAEERLYLSGEANDDGAYTGTYYEYDEESQELKPHTGTYVRTDNENIAEYEFTYDETVEQPGENGEAQPVHPSFRFIVAFDSATRFPVFRIYTIEVRLPLYSGISGGNPVAALEGGGYSDLILTLANGNRAAGQLLIYPNASLFLENALLCAFADMSAEPQLFFALIGSGESARAVVLDGTFSDLNFGRFYHNDGNIVLPTITEDGKLAGTEAWDIDGVAFNGLGIAMLYTAAGEDGQSRVYRAMYMNYSAGNYILFTFVEEQPYIIGQFRLYDNSTADPARPYIIRFADANLNKAYSNSDGEVFIADGFSAAVYVDKNGVAHSGVFNKVEGHDEVIRILYLDGFNVVTLYVEPDSDSDTFTVLPADDPRIPAEQSGDTENAEGDNA